MGIAGIDEWGKSEECCNATPDPYDSENSVPVLETSKFEELREKISRIVGSGPSL
jgi:hypothetical protein